jgi:cytochrome c-type biogenesis protein CcmH
MINPNQKSPKGEVAMSGDLKRKSWIILSIFVLLSLIPVGVSAQGSEPTDDEVNAIAKQLYCPVCENIPLDACGTQACEQWRGIIRDQLADGRTEDEIKDYFVAQYGDRVLAEPPPTGFNWAIYLVPLVVFLIGGYLFFRGIKRWLSTGSDKDRRRETKKAVDPQKPSEDDIRRVEEELLKRTRD